MGFRDLALYNDSLLAKQAWRLLQNRLSLFYKVFKARFFFSKLFYYGGQGFEGGLYDWRSILKGRDVIQRGARRRVGDGKSINIWQHRWIPRKLSSLVVSYPIESMDDCSVPVLINESARRWKEELIDGIFSQEEATLIKKIPLSRRVSEDVLIWPYTQDGQHTCKTGYRFLKEEAEMRYMQ